MVHPGINYNGNKITIDKIVIIVYSVYIQFINGHAKDWRTVEHMNIIISNSSGKPIYEQITSQIKQMIMSGELSPGDSLPSMRFLAKELRISVITTKRAYEDLERDGFICTQVGKGSFVADTNHEIVREEQLKTIEKYLQQAVDYSIQSNVSKEELIEMLEMLYEEE